MSGFVAMISWFYVVTQIPLPESVSITFIVPILTMVCASIIFKEKINQKLWLSLFFGMIGVLVIIRPGFAEITTAHLIAILSAVLWSFSNVLTKKLTLTDKPKTVALYLSTMILIVSIPAAAPYLKPMNFEQIIWMFLLGLSGNLAHIFLSTAYVKTELSILQPFDFTRLIFVSIIAYFAFNELVDIYMIAGSMIIIFSSFYLSVKGRVRRNSKSQKFKDIV
jgi:drug/metabolite transporter (DMT)-like permease